MAKSEFAKAVSLIIGGAIGAVLLGGIFFGGMLFYDRDIEQTDLVILEAPTDPIKIEPEDKGGKKVNSIDSPVLSLLDNVIKPEEGVETVLPPDTKPEPGPIDLTEEPEEAVTATTEDVQEAEEQVEETAESTAPEEPVTEESAPVETTSAEEDAPEDIDEITAAIDDLSGQDQQPYVVQFAALKDEEKAKTAAALLFTKHKSRLGGMTLTVTKGNDWWRVVVAETLSNADAIVLCDKFRSAGQDCVVREKP
jgi:hypothetical protein